MRTYIYTETDSPKRGMDVRISVWRMKNNQPHGIGITDHQTASWMGARAQAVHIIHDAEGIPYAKNHEGQTDTYRLRGLLDFGYMYNDCKQPRNAVRLFGI